MCVASQGFSEVKCLQCKINQFFALNFTCRDFISISRVSFISNSILYHFILQTHHLLILPSDFSSQTRFMNCLTEPFCRKTVTHGIYYACNYGDIIFRKNQETLYCPPKLGNFMEDFEFLCQLFDVDWFIQLQIEALVSIYWRM